MNNKQSFQQLSSQQQTTAITNHNESSVNMLKLQMSDYLQPTHLSSKEIGEQSIRAFVRQPHRVEYQDIYSIKKLNMVDNTRRLITVLTNKQSSSEAK